MADAAANCNRTIPAQKPLTVRSRNAMMDIGRRERQDDRCRAAIAEPNGRKYDQALQ
jgi:hypothetical protein